MVLKCPKCPAEFASNRDLQRHLERKVPCDSENCKCSGCDQPFQTKKNLQTHQKKGRCKGKKPAAIAEELAVENEKLRSLLTAGVTQIQSDLAIASQQEMLNVTKAATAAASQHLKQQPQTDITNHNQDINSVTIKQPRKTKSAGPEFIYAVWSKSNRTIKAGYWKGTLKALRQRYVTVLGKNMQIMLFQCQNRVLTERLMFDKLKPWHVESELYNIECLKSLPLFILSLSSVSDAVQKSEHTEGGYLFTRDEDDANAVQKSEQTEGGITRNEDDAKGDAQISDNGPGIAPTCKPTPKLDVELLKVRLEKVGIRKQVLALQEQKLVLQEQELALREQLLLVEQQTPVCQTM